MSTVKMEAKVGTTTAKSSRLIQHLLNYAPFIDDNCVATRDELTGLSPGSLIDVFLQYPRLNHIYGADYLEYQDRVRKVAHRWMQSGVGVDQNPVQRERELLEVIATTEVAIPDLDGKLKAEEAHDEGMKGELHISRLLPSIFSRRQLIRALEHAHVSPEPTPVELRRVRRILWNVAFDMKNEQFDSQKLVLDSDRKLGNIVRIAHLERFLDVDADFRGHIAHIVYAVTPEDEMPRMSVEMLWAGVESNAMSRWSDPAKRAAQEINRRLSAGDTETASYFAHMIEQSSLRRGTLWYNLETDILPNHSALFLPTIVTKLQSAEISAGSGKGFGALSRTLDSFLADSAPQNATNRKAFLQANLPMAAATDIVKNAVRCLIMTHNDANHYSEIADMLCLIDSVSTHYPQVLKEVRGLLTAYLYQTNHARWTVSRKTRQTPEEAAATLFGKLGIT